MSAIAGIIATIFILVVLWDAFETVILPRRVRRRVRITLVINRLTWGPWVLIGRKLHNSRREAFLSFYGPLSLIMLLGVWAVILILAFATIQWAQGSPLAVAHGEAPTSFGTDIYMSGSTFFTLGIGDVVPTTALARTVTVVEAGMGFAFLALVIGYLPILYQAFSRREATISLLDARAGSPPTALELLRRNSEGGSVEALVQLLRDWERWCAELLESHLSYPPLGYFRSQHENQSWVSALTAILDLCSLILVGVDDIPTQPARVTYAIARHAAVDLSQVFRAPPTLKPYDRLPPDDLRQLRELLVTAGLELREGPEVDEHLTRLRAKYEPYVCALAEATLSPLPPWIPAADARDDWQTSPDE